MKHIKVILIIEYSINSGVIITDGFESDRLLSDLWRLKSTLQLFTEVLIPLVIFSKSKDKIFLFWKEILRLFWCTVLTHLPFSTSVSCHCSSVAPHEFMVIQWMTALLCWLLLGKKQWKHFWHKYEVLQEVNNILWLVKISRLLDFQRDEAVVVTSENTFDMIYDWQIKILFLCHCILLCTS